MEQPDAQLYVAAQRGYRQTDQYRSYHTFTVGDYVADNREAFGALRVFTETVLPPGASLTQPVDEAVGVVVLPLIGGLAYGTGAAATDFLQPGLVGTLSLAAGDSYTVSNPYETETISFIHCWLTHTGRVLAARTEETAFDLLTKNTLLPLFDASGSQGFIGQYGGRQEGTYRFEPTPGTRRGVFFFVLAGVFEVADRLLHEKDGLSLRYQQRAVIEFEALSNDAMLLLIDVAG